MNEFRCDRCGRLLAKELIKEGSLYIKCPKCGAYNRIRVVGGKVDVVDSHDKNVYSNC